MKNRIGVQFSTIKSKVVQLGVYDTFREIANTGVKVVELSQIAITPNNIEEINKACEDFGMEICAMSATIDPMMPGMGGECLANDFDKIVADCKAVNCKFIRIGMMPMNLLASNKEGIINFAKRANEFAQRLAEEGIELYYHNHHVEFKKVEGEYLLDLLKDNAPLMGFELDIHWIQRAGLSPIDTIKKYDGRVKLLHLKDYRIGTVDMAALSQGMAGFMKAFDNVVEFAEVGEGNLDIKGCIEMGKECGANYFLIEQDTTYGKDPFVALKTSVDNLIALGYGDWL